MPFTIPNYDSATYPDQAEPDSVDFKILGTGISGNGVISGCEVAAKGTPDMNVTVSAGTIVVGGTVAAVSAGTLSVSSANATNARFDLVRVNSSGSLSILAGTASSNPVFNNTLSSTEVALASLYIPANASSVTANQIVDKRLTVVYNVFSSLATHIKFGL